MKSPIVPASEHQPLLVPIDQAARMLGLSRSTLYEMLARGELPKVKYGTAVRIPVSALHEWVSRNATYGG